MKKIFLNFFRNHFWTDKIVLILILSCLIFIAGYWVSWFLKIKIEILPFITASAIFLLNFCLAIFAYPKNKLVSFLLLAIAILVQILTLVLLRYLFYIQII